jgi:hypothetical protein
VNGDEPLVGAAAVHHLMKGWVANTNDTPAKEDNS